MKITTRMASVTLTAALCLASASYGFQAIASAGSSTRPTVKSPQTASTQGVSDAQLLAQPLVAPPKPGLIARKPVPKLAVIRPAKPTNMLIVKFGDPVLGAGAVRNGNLSLKQPFANEFQLELDELAQRFGVKFREAVPHDQATLEALYQRAERNTGRMQPNLKSYVYAEGPIANLQAVAVALNGMPIVENVSWFEDMRPTGGDDPVGACCMPDDSCEVLSMADCGAAGGAYNGDDTDCEPDPCNDGACCFETADGFDCMAMDEDSCNNLFGGYFQGDGVDCMDMDGNLICDDLNEDCGEPTSGSCYWTDGENGTPFCSNQNCCDLVCDQDPFCCDENNGRWDQYCAAVANQLCETPPADRCNTPLNGTCVEPHGGGGCDNSACCNTVCAIQPSCCETAWSSFCVELARQNCSVADDTADWTPLQGYLTQAGYDMIPDELLGLLPFLDGGQVFFGFGGEGWNLFDPMDPHAGIYGLGQELIDVYNVDRYGEGVLTRGKSIKVGVIEWGYWGPEPYTDANGNGEYDDGESFSDVNGNGIWDEQHEDLDVTLEEGQSLFLNPTIAENDHGTACLGIINGQENGVGVTGIAPEADAYFFPLTSVEEGPRPLAAWTSALNAFGPGDVISASYGPGPPIGCLNNDGVMWSIIRLASDLGITVCVAAGNDCYNLDNAPDLGDSGGIVVGACSPGIPWYRLGFSNFCTNPPSDNSRGNIVHVKAWGTAVTTTGYGGLSLPGGDSWRSYTNSFGGTSAAAPQIAGLVACLQGLAKQFYGIPLRPEQIRGAMGAPGTPPPLPAPRLFGGFDDDSGQCTPDLDSSAGPHMIGPYPDVAGSFGSASTTILNQSFAGFGDSPLLEDVVILNGDHVFGTDFSVFGSDDNYLVINSQPVGSGGPSVPDDLPPSVPPGAIGKMRYLAPGQNVDVLVVGRSPVNVVSNMTIFAEYQPPAGVISLGFIEAFDWYSLEWVFIGMNVHFNDPEVTVAETVPNAQRFVRPSDRTVLYRFYITGWGFSGGLPGASVGGSGRTRQFVERLDWFGLGIEEGFASPLPGPPIF